MKISVVTAVYNAQTTIADTIRSVASQTWTDHEHVIVDGASTDQTMDVVSREDNARLRVISERDTGVYDAMNKGLATATGDVVVFVNADDFLARPDALAMVAHAFERTSAECVVGRTVIVRQDNIGRVTRLYDGASFRPWMLRFGHMPPHPSFYARRALLQDIGGFDASYRIGGDFDQMVRLFLLRRTRLASIPATLSGFREGGISTRDLSASRAINREIGRSLREHGVGGGGARLYLRYPLKALQLVGRPRDYHSNLPLLNLSTPLRP